MQEESRLSRRRPCGSGVGQGWWGAVRRWAGGGWLFDLSFIDVPSRKRMSRMLMPIVHMDYIYTLVKMATGKKEQGGTGRRRRQNLQQKLQL